MYFVLLLLTALVAGGSALAAHRRTRDLFHPLVLIAPMLVVLYVLLPLKLAGDDVLRAFFAEGELEFVGSVNLIGVAAFCLGCFYAAQRRILPPAEPAPLPTRFRERIYVVGVLLGCAGVAAYVVGLVNVGGFVAAYSETYGGGWSEIGYVRDAVSLCIPGIILVIASCANRRATRKELLACFVFALPFLLQGLLGARRGPTFVVLAALGVSWYMVRGRRPRAVVLFGAGVGLGVLLLFLVSNRGNISLNSDFNFENSGLEYLEVDNPDYGTGNEYIYGAGTILHTQATGEFYWGRRYFAEVFIRPIPRQIWQTKYEDFGVEAIERNAGTRGEDFISTLGWTGTEGAAPGLIADLWLEFWWFYVPVIAFVGWAYGRAWRAANLRGGFAILIYVFMVALSLFLVFQTVEAILVRFLFMLVPAWLGWRWARSARGGARSQIPAGARVPANVS